MPLHHPACTISNAEPDSAALAEFGAYLDASAARADLADVARILGPLMNSPALELPCLQSEPLCMGGQCQRCRLEKIVSEYLK